MTLDPHPDPVGQVPQVQHRFFPVQVPVEEVHMEVEAGWVEA